MSQTQRTTRTIRRGRAMTGLAFVGAIHIADLVIATIWHAAR